jgi:hypothetical protein
MSFHLLSFGTKRDIFTFLPPPKPRFLSLFVSLSNNTKPFRTVSKKKTKFSPSFHPSVTSISSVDAAKITLLKALSPRQSAIHPHRNTPHTFSRSAGSLVLFVVRRSRSRSRARGKKMEGIRMKREINVRRKKHLAETAREECDAGLIAQEKEESVSWSIFKRVFSRPRPRSHGAPKRMAGDPVVFFFFFLSFFLSFFLC